ncbi:hypothetical protein CAPTEDRAFT_227726 [Capitella teleta]|uniref:C-type lectin domain-containing protein n=1 Tax=Capitella teleta TaxID=283909 RepID=R7UPG2_CAPTE|nr:hypothetical protein CAPTEDRAFT_227726 [Capitella teleta]|eukprot:ELU08050.1 hypothetical protein CAPTEDRAFT_227726 [Capitella teleta]
MKMERNVNFARCPLVTIASILLLSLAVHAADDASVRCPSNLPYTSKMTVFRDTCYQFVRTEKFWEEARDMCWAWGGKLLEIKDGATNNFIKDTLNSMSIWSNKGIWIGLNDRNLELVWRWIGTKSEHDSGVRPLDPTFAYWAGSHPGAWFHSMKDCVRMDRGAQWRWKETPCAGLKWHYRFICQYAAAPTAGFTNQRNSFQLEAKNQELARGGPNDAMNQKAESLIVSESSTNSDSTGTLIMICVFAVVLVGCLVWLVLLFVRRRLHQKPTTSEAFVVVTCSDKFNNPLYGNGQEGLAQCVLNTPRQPQTQAEGPRENLYVSPEEMAGTGAVAAKEDVYLAPVEERGSKRPLPECPQGKDADQSKPLSGYLPMDQVSRRGSTNTLEMALDDVEEESPGFAYDTPKASHIYSEIPCDESNVYEALDDVQY